MHEGIERFAAQGDAGTPATVCPGWCVAGHGVQSGQEDWIHLGEPVVVADGGITARLCMSVNPGTGAVDGPYVLFGSSEYTPVPVKALGRALLRLAELALETTPPENPSGPPGSPAFRS